MKLSIAKSASIQMDDSPTNTPATGTGTTLVSLFQAGALAMRGDWFINWAKGDDAVAFCELPIPVGSPAW